MASGFFALLDDISTLMEQSSVITKSAAKNTAGVLGDDLAVSAAKASSFPASRELPVLWAITKGSFLNKIVIIPIMIALSYFFPKIIAYILILGGIYLAYEGAHGIWGYIFPHNEDEDSKIISENQKIKSAITTDFVLSLEIVLIALSTVQDSPLKIKIFVVTIVSFLATIGVYGLVALLVRLDDIGLAISQNEPQNSIKYKFGNFLIKALPIIVRILSIIGIFAMLLVAGGIFMHNIHILHEIIPFMPQFIKELIAAILIGGIAMLLIDGTKFIINKIKGA